MRLRRLCERFGLAVVRQRSAAVLAGCVVMAAVGACESDPNEPGALARVIIDKPADDTLLVQETVRLSAVAVDGQQRELPSATRGIAWASTNTDVATVDERSGLVTAVAPGTADISATVSGKADVMTFHVLQTLGSLAVTLDGPDSVRVGDDRVACAVILGANGDTVAGRQVDWSVSDPAVATGEQRSDGCLTIHGVKSGAVTVSASTGGGEQGAELQSDTALRVIPPVDHVTLTTISEPVTAGDCVSLEVEAADDANKPLNRTVTFSSSNEAVATVDGAGLACWESPGSATLTAKSEGKSDSFTAQVQTAPFTVVGYADLDNGSRRAFKWTLKGGLEAIPLLERHVSSLGKGANDNGQIVGETMTGAQIRHAFIYTAGRGTRELPLPEGAVGGEATAINNNGQVAGSAFFADGSQHLVLWAVAGSTITVVDKGTPAGSTQANAMAINSNGIVVGNSVDPNSGGRTRAYRSTSNGTLIYLRDVAGERRSETTGINTHADVVGFFDDEAGVRRPYVSPDGNSDKEPTELPPECPRAVGYGIDADRRIAVTGLSCGTDEKDRAYTRTRGGTYTQLFGPNSQARAMNERGDVAGFTVLNGMTQAFLWRRGAASGTVLGLLGGGTRTSALALNAGQ